MMDLLAHDRRTTDYLDDALKSSVTAAMRQCVAAKPNNGIGFIVDHLNANNASRQQSSVTIHLQNVEYPLTRSRLDVPTLRQYIHPKLPVIGDQDPTKDEVYKLINTIRDTHTARLADRAAEVTVDPRSKSVQGVSEAELAPPPVVKPSRIKLLIVAPVNKEIVFIGNQPMVGAVAEARARDRSDLCRTPRVQRQLSGHSMREYSDIEQTGSDGDSSTDQSSPLNNTLPGAGVPIRGLDVPYAQTRKVGGHSDLEETIAQAAVDQGIVGASKQGAIPLRQLGDYVSKVFSTSGIIIESCVLRVPERYRIGTEIFERVDEFVGISDMADIVPTVVVSFGLRPFIFRNVLSILVAAMMPILEVANFAHNEALLRKRAIETKAREQRNEWRLVNAAAYWVQVRSRREARDKHREQLALEVAKRQPQPPLPSNATEEERIAYDEKRKRDEAARAQLEAAFEEATHKARIARQARRSREDVEAAEVMNKQANASGLVIQSVLRGYLIRRKMRDRLASLRATKLSDSLNSSVRSQRKVKRVGKIDEVDRLAEIRYLSERHVLSAMLASFNETLTLKPAPEVRPPRSYVSWIPKTKKIPPPFEGDVSSDDEGWEKETLVVAPLLPTSRFRLVNPCERLNDIFLNTGNDIVRYIDDIASQFGNVSPLQRQAYFALQTKIHHLLHVIYLELTHREIILPEAGGFTQFVLNHFPQMDCWFVNPLVVNDIFSNAPEPAPVLIGAQPQMLDRNNFICFDSGSFDFRTVYRPVVHNKDPSSPKAFASETPVLDRAESMVANAMAHMGLGTSHDGHHAHRQHHDDGSATPTAADNISPNRVREVPTNDGSAVVRIRASGLYVTSDGISLDTVRQSLATIARSGAKRLLWLQCTPEPMTYVDRKPFFLSRRWETQSLPGRPSYLDFGAMTNVIATNADGTPVGDRVASPGRRRSFGNKSPGVAPTGFSTSHARQIAGAMPASATATATSVSNAKVPFAPQAVLDTADRVSAEFRGVSWLEMEERLRAELLTITDRAEGVFNFLAHKSASMSDFIIPQANGQHVLINDAYRPQVDVHLLPTPTVSARGPLAEVLEEHSVIIALPKKEAPVRSSIATTRSSMFMAPDQSIALASSRDMRGMNESTTTPRAFGTQPKSAASKSMRLSVASKSDSLSDPHGDNHQDDKHQGRGSLSLAPAPTLPDVDALPMLIQSPLQAFDELLLVASFAERKFARLPLLSTNGLEWLARVSHLSKMAFTHLRDAQEQNALVLSLPDESALIYAAIIEVINVVLIERAHVQTTTPQQSPTAAGAPVDPVFASLRIAPGGSKSLHGSEKTTSSKPAKPQRTEPDRVFGCILGLDLSEPDLGLRGALRALDSILPAAGLANVRDGVISLRRKAELARGTPECRGLVRECCCALERYVWLVYFTSLALQSAAEGSYSVPDLYDSVIQTAGGESIERLVYGIDPWATSPRSSPDPYHVSMYSAGVERWKQLHFVTRVQ